jgi:hypothetical protein
VYEKYMVMMMGCREKTSFARIKDHLFGMSRRLGRDGLLTMRSRDVIGYRHALLAFSKGIHFALADLLMYVIDGRGRMVVTMALGAIEQTF